MKKLRWLLAVILLLCTQLVSAEEKVEPKAVISRLLKESGAITFAEKTPYGEGIESLFIGFDGEGKAIIAIALRMTKTYEKVYTILAVKPSEAGFTVSAAEIPDLATFRAASQPKASQVLKDVTGKVFKGAAEAKGLADSVSGATKYAQAIYVSYSLMATKMIEALSTIPEWPRTPVQQ